MTSPTCPCPDEPYIGNRAVITASGGFTVEQGLEPITLLREDEINEHDVTDAIQIKMDVRTFNEKLGIVKDISNLDVITTMYDPEYNVYLQDSIEITVEDFVAGASVANIVSVGKLRTLYSDFIEFINKYFDYPAGFTSLFTISSQYELNDGVFDEYALYNLFTSREINYQGEYISAIAGSINLSGLTNLMTTVINTNAFGNRDPAGNANTSSDTTNRNNYTLADGFLAGDLIYVPNGFEISMSLSVSNNDVFVNSDGYSHASTVSNDYYYGTYCQTTTVSDNNLYRTVKCPLLLRLTNMTSGTPGSSMSFNICVQLDAYDASLNTLSINTVLDTTAEILGVKPYDISYINQTSSIGNSNRNSLANIYRLSRMSKCKDISFSYVNYDLSVHYSVHIDLSNIRMCDKTAQGLFRRYKNTLKTNSFDRLLHDNAHDLNATQLYSVLVLKVNAYDFQTYLNGYSTSLHRTNHIHIEQPRHRIDICGSWIDLSGACGDFILEDISYININDVKMLSIFEDISYVNIGNTDVSGACCDATQCTDISANYQHVIFDSMPYTNLESCI